MKCTMKFSALFVVALAMFSSPHVNADAELPDIADMSGDAAGDNMTTSAPTAATSAPTAAMASPATSPADTTPMISSSQGAMSTSEQTTTATQGAMSTSEQTTTATQGAMSTSEQMTSAMENMSTSAVTGMMMSTSGATGGSTTSAMADMTSSGASTESVTSQPMSSEVVTSTESTPVTPNLYIYSWGGNISKCKEEQPPTEVYIVPSSLCIDTADATTRVPVSIIIAPAASGGYVYLSFENQTQCENDPTFNISVDNVDTTCFQDETFMNSYYLRIYDVDHFHLASVTTVLNCTSGMCIDMSASTPGASGSMVSSAVPTGSGMMSSAVPTGSGMMSSSVAPGSGNMTSTGAPASTGSGSGNKTEYMAIGVSLGVAVVVVAIFIFIVCKTRKQQRQKAFEMLPTDDDGITHMNQFDEKLITYEDEIPSSSA